MFSIPTAPAKQSVGDTISILSGRLASATLLEDRRAAILGLRSFAKDFPASVSSGALRSLIGCLGKDGEDVDTVKVVLETLLMLFNPNEDSPETSDEIVLWLADEFTQRQENITLILDFLDSTEFYSRLYSLQLLAAILAARTDRTEECVLAAPFGISRLTAVLEDNREAIRNEAISLLTYLTPSSIEIQKLVAFENAFDRLFSIIKADGSLAEGGRNVEDCLILLANLLRHNSSNQSLFRESGCLNKLTELLSSLLGVNDAESNIAGWAETQRNRNVYAFLAVIRLFLPIGSSAISQNQQAFWKHGLVSRVLQLAFSCDHEIEIRAEALLTCGDMIRDAAALQENFAQLTVTPPIDGTEKSESKPNGSTKIYVIDGLLDLTLNMHDQTAFNLRFAACECLKSYFSKHTEVRLHFLHRAVNGHQGEREESANVLTVLLGPSSFQNTDPYRYWFAAVIVFHLLSDNPKAKEMASGLTEGDSTKGEEVVTGIQTVSAHLITSIQRGDDIRISVGYLMVLLCWLFEDIDAVSDFLTEGSNVQSLVQIVAQSVSGREIVQGLCCVLLGVVYEYSTKDSPISRTALHSILTSRLGSEIYFDRLQKLRSHTLMRDFEVTPKQDSSQGGFPSVMFDDSFVYFFKDNFSRISRAIEREPGMEISVVTNGVQKGISRDLVDSLRAQIREKDEALETSKSSVTSMEKSLHQAQAEIQSTKAEAQAEMSRAQDAHNRSQASHQTELRNLEGRWSARVSEREAELTDSRVKFQTELENLQRQIDAAKATHQQELKHNQKAYQSEIEKVHQRGNAQAADQRATISQLEVELAKINKFMAQEQSSLRKRLSDEAGDHAAQMQNAKEEIAALQEQLNEARRETDDAVNKNKGTKSELSEATQAREATQAELDDLLIVFGDLEEKLEKYKIRLRQHGEAVSDGEDGEDDDSDENEEGGKDATDDELD